MIIKDKIKGFIFNLKLGFEFAKRDLQERYAGTNFGHLWLLISPLITIFIYTVIFSDFMKMKMNIVNSEYAYSIYLIPGLISWNFFSTVVLRLTGSVLDKSYLLKKVNIPMYVYYISIVLSESVIYITGMVLGVVFLLLVHHHIGISFLILPFLMFLVALFAFGLGVVFSLFTPFFKDFREIINIILQLWFWLTPIIYVKELIYSKYPYLVDYNPLYFFIEPMQTLFLYDKVLWSDIKAAFLIALVTLLAASFLYKKLISEIKDII
ncbi:ABC transporter permease [Caminibacter sp.]